MKKITLLLVLAISLFITKEFQGQNLNLKTTQESKIDTFVVCGNCYTCKLRIHEVLESLSGINSFDWSWSEYLAIDYNPEQTAPADFLQPIAYVGHDNEMFQAPKEAYNELVGTCCEYDRWLSYETTDGNWEVKGEESCKTELLEAANDLHGITEADWSNESLSSSYYHQITDADNILLNLALAGYDNEKFTAPNEAYNALPEGCKYERDGVNINTNKIVSFEVYPNPASSKIVLPNKTYSNYKIIDLSGKTVISNSSNFSNSIDISGLSKGRYQIILKNNSDYYSSSFIKN